MATKLKDWADAGSHPAAASTTRQQAIRRSALAHEVIKAFPQRQADVRSGTGCPPDTSKASESGELKPGDLKPVGIKPNGRKPGGRKPGERKQVMNSGIATNLELGKWTSDRMIRNPGHCGFGIMRPLRRRPDAQAHCHRQGSRSIKGRHSIRHGATQTSAGLAATSWSFFRFPRKAIIMAFPLELEGGAPWT